MSRKIGWVGTGNIGKPMAVSVLKAGFDLTLFARKAEAKSEMRGLGARIAGSLRGMAESNDLIVSMVRDKKQTEEVLFGKDGLWEGLRPGTILVIMSTIAPEYVREVSLKASEKGVIVIDAPVSGSRKGAEEQSLSIMVGGEARYVEECRPFFQAMGRHIFHIGGIGSGMVMKLVNNAVSAMTLFAAAEGVKLGLKAGISHDRLLEVVRVSSGNSQKVERWDYYEGQIRSYGQDPRSTNLPLLLGKDVVLALDLAKGLGIQLPVLDFISKENIAAGWV